jgi:hypothetical protein
VVFFSATFWLYGFFQKVLLVWIFLLFPHPLMVRFFGPISNTQLLPKTVACNLLTTEVCTV